MGLNYNGVDLSWVKTEGVLVQPEYDKDDSDMLWNRIRISVDTVVNAAVAPALAWGLGAPAAAARLRDDLCVPRRTLVYSVAGVEVLRVDAPANLHQFTDDELGPKVTCETTGITPASFHLRFTVEAKVRECLGATSPISIRWEMSDTLDANWFRTRRTTGTLISSGQSLVHPDDQQMRLAITPDLPPGFRRERSNYTLDPSGLRVRFEFEDRQLARTPPRPGTRMSGKQSETVERNSQIRFGTVHVRLEGPPAAGGAIDEKEHVRGLMDAAATIAVDRMQASQPFETRDTRVMLGGEFGESLNDHEMAVEVSMGWMIRPAQRGDPAGRIGVTWLGRNIPGSRDGDVQGKVAPPVRGVPTLGSLPDQVALIAVALRDPCGPNPARTDKRRLVVPPPAAATGPPAPPAPPQIVPFGGWFRLERLTAVIAPVIADAVTSVVADPDPGVWESYAAEVKHIHDPGVIVLPVTDPDGVNVKVRTHSEMMRVVVEWRASKYFSPPSAPKPQTTDDNLVYVGGTLGTPHVEPAPDGMTPKYALCGIYEYEALDVSAVKLRAPSAPYLDTGFGISKGQLAWSNLGANPLDSPSTGSLSDGNPFDAPAGSGGSAGGPTVGA